MTDRSFDIRIEQNVKPFLEKMGIFQCNIYDRKNHYAKRVKEISRIGSYQEIYNAVVTTCSYDILLKDGSVFQFHKVDGKEEYRYCFIQNPRMKLSWEDFLRKIGVEENDDQPIPDVMQWQAYYDNDEDDCFDINNYPVSIRYDASESEYVEGEHPFSHFHIGIHNDIRIPISLILTPEMFTEFIVKMVYRKEWLYKKNDNYFVDFHSSVKKGCKPVIIDFLSDLDKLDLYMK